MKNKRFLYLTLPIITLILELLPYGAICNFANEEGGTIRKSYSYFDLLPFGYANFGPFLTAITTCAALALLITYCVLKKERLAFTAKVILCCSAVLSLCPLLYGISFFSVVGALISISLIAEIVLLHVGGKQ